MRHYGSTLEYNSSIRGKKGQYGHSRQEHGQGHEDGGHDTYFRKADKTSFRDNVTLAPMFATLSLARSPLGTSRSAANPEQTLWRSAPARACPASSSRLRVRHCSEAALAHARMSCAGSRPSVPPDRRPGSLQPGHAYDLADRTTGIADSAERTRKNKGTAYPFTPLLHLACRPSRLTPLPSTNGPRGSRSWMAPREGHLLHPRLKA